MKIIIGDQTDYDWQHMVKTYRQYVNPKSVVLEIGASVTTRTQEIAKYVKKVIGLEYFPKRLPISHGNIEYRLGDWQQLSKIVKPSSIDCAISSHVIEHIPNDLKAINELYRVLKTNGIAIINTPNRNRLIRKIIEIFTGPRVFPYWEHVREYSQSDIISLLKKSKFKKYTITPIIFGLHGGKHYKFYFPTVPKLFIKNANYWEVVLFK
jgi:ubiquinone/menaquinone biosynthesis C-methylase UbiE